MTRIADDFSAINRSVAQLESERRDRRFALPDGVIIYLDREVSPFMAKPECEVALVLHRLYNRITILTMSDTRRVSIGSLIAVLRQQFPSISLATKHEIALSDEDSKRLAAWVQAQR
jgi:hypothetical protein